MLSLLYSVFNLFGRFWIDLQHGSVPALGNWNYLLLFVFVIIQGPLVKLLSGAVAQTRYLDLTLVLFVSITASMCADYFWYTIGKVGKVQRYFGKRSSKKKEMVEMLESAMHKHYVQVMLLGKLSLGIAAPTMLASGILKLPWRRWWPVALLGESLFTILMVLIGYFTAASITHMDHTLRVVGLTISGVCLAILVIWLPINLRKTVLKDVERSKQQVALSGSQGD